jgi:pullulanase
MMKWLLLVTVVGLAGKILGQAIPVYAGPDLGLTYKANSCSFRIWAPVADSVRINFYHDAEGGTALRFAYMKRSTNGTWKYDYAGLHAGEYYTFQVLTNNTWSIEVTDPYAKIVGTNGSRAYIADITATDPLDWKKDRLPALPHTTDAIIYELHVRDASIAPNSGISAKGKYAGLTELTSVNGEGMSTGLKHMLDLGITHVHLLPFFDYNSIDEHDPNGKYNWGYDPLNYNVPEGSYASTTLDPLTRIFELKKMIRTFHKNGLRIVMDVVYNHTALGPRSNFNVLAPDYYYRHTADGKFSNATACGNETASEKAMMRKFMIESMLFWVKEYHVDGFRIDLMGVHDIETMNAISKELNKVLPGILLYGEGWTAGTSPLPDSMRALKKNVSKLDRVAVFSDDMRDGIKGSVFDHKDRGFASGKAGMEESIKFGIVGSGQHPQVDYNKVNYSKSSYSTAPGQVINYADCHDNHTLWDKLAISAATASEAERKEMQKLALSIVLTSQGIPFLHAGSEFLRTKQGVENSYNSPDSINAIDWSLKTKNRDVFDYVRFLIQLRRTHPAFRLNTAAQIRMNLRFITDRTPPGVIAYTLNGKAAGDKDSQILVCFNGTGQKQKIMVPGGKWRAVVQNNSATSGNINSNTLEMSPYSCSILMM